MVDFQTLTLSSITLLTAAMFIFYYLLVIKTRRTPPVIQKHPQITPEVQTSISQTKIEEATPNPIQTPTQAPVQIKTPTEVQTPISQTKIEEATPNPIQTPTQAAVQVKAPIVETPTQTQNQTSNQTPVQAAHQIPVQAPPPENVINLPVDRTPILHGEDATEALKEFAKELEKGGDIGAVKTRDASLLKLARVLIGVIQAEKPPEEITQQPDLNMQDVEPKTTQAESPLEPDRPEKENKSIKHQKSRIRRGKRKTKAKRKLMTKNDKHGRKPRKHSRPTQVHSKRAQKVRRAKKRTDKKSTRSPIRYKARHTTRKC